VATKPNYNNQATGEELTYGRARWNNKEDGFIFHASMHYRTHAIRIFLAME